MKRPLTKVGTLAITAGILAGILVAPFAGASSHREAPLISKDPTADNTDVYAFVSPDRPNTVTLIANYIPFEDPAGGPTFYEFDPTVRYAIHVDNDGDGTSDIDYRFRFETRIRNRDTFLYNTGPISSLDDPDWNVPQFYTVTRVEPPTRGSHAPDDDSDDGVEERGQGIRNVTTGTTTTGTTTTGTTTTGTTTTGTTTTGTTTGTTTTGTTTTGTTTGGGRGRQTLGSNLPTPPVNIGPRSTPDYEALAAAAVHSLPGDRKVFAGQRDDPFFVDLGSVFDLLGLRPFNNAHRIPLAPNAAGIDGLGGFNVHTIALQVPITDLTRDHAMPSGPNDPKAVIGVYASASRQKVRVLNEDADDKNNGPFVQVSRLANPLINEVIIPLGKKDAWNRQDPAGDRQFLEEYRNPELPGLVNLLYPALPDAATSDRSDLVAILLTGVKIPPGKIPGVENLNFTGDTPADLLRLNLAIPPTGAPSRLGVLEGDLAGFPNGRRLADDVTDIELRALAEGYGPILNAVLGLPNRSPNNTLGDGVDRNDRPFLSTFPYVATPHQGYEHEHHEDSVAP